MQHHRGILSSHYLDGIWPQAHNCSGRVSEVLISQVGATSPIFLPFLKRSAAAGSWETDLLWLHQPLALSFTGALLDNSHGASCLQVSLLAPAPPRLFLLPGWGLQGSGPQLSSLFSWQLPEVSTAPGLVNPSLPD